MRFARKISKFKAIELDVLQFRWSKTAQVFTPFCLDCNLHYRGDHSPSFYIQCVLLNINLIEFSWHDIRHEEDLDDSFDVHD